MEDEYAGDYCIVRLFRLNNLYPYPGRQFGHVTEYRVTVSERNRFNNRVSFSIKLINNSKNI